MGISIISVCDLTIEKLDELLERGEFFNVRGDLLSDLPRQYAESKRDNWVCIKEFADHVGYKPK